MAETYVGNKVVRQRRTRLEEGLKALDLLVREDLLENAAIDLRAD